MKTLQTTFESSEADRLQRLLASKWADLTAFGQLRSGVVVPRPLVVTMTGGVVGGASVTSVTESGGADPVIWLNGDLAVFRWLIAR